MGSKAEQAKAKEWAPSEATISLVHHILNMEKHDIQQETVKQKINSLQPYEVEQALNRGSQYGWVVHHQEREARGCCAFLAEILCPGRKRLKEWKRTSIFDMDGAPEKRKKQLEQHLRAYFTTQSQYDADDNPSSS